MSPAEKIARLRELFRVIDEAEAEINQIIGAYPEPTRQSLRKKKKEVIETIEEYRARKLRKKSKPIESVTATVNESENKPKRKYTKKSKTEKPFVVSVKYRCQDCNETYKVGIGEAATCPFCESDNYEAI